MGRRRRRLHARPAGSQPPEAKASAAPVPRSDGAMLVSSTGRGKRRANVVDSAPEREKRRKLENADGETTEEDEQTTLADLNGSDQNGSDQAGSDQGRSDQNGSDRAGSRENGAESGGGTSDPGPLLTQGDPETSILVTCGRNEGRLYLSKLRVVVNERCRSKCIRTGNTWWTPNEFQFVSGRGAAKDWKRTVKHAGKCLKALLTSGTLSLSSAPPRCLCDSCTSQGSDKPSDSSDNSDNTGRNINETRKDLSSGSPVQDASDGKNKAIKRRRCIKRRIKGGVPFVGARLEEPVPFKSKKRRKFLRNAKPEPNSDSTVSLSADGVFENGNRSQATQEGVAVASSSDISRPEVAPVSEPPVVQKRRPGRPKKKPVVVGPAKQPEVAPRDVNEAKVMTENPISDPKVSSLTLDGATEESSGCTNEATPSSEPSQNSPGSKANTEPVTESSLPENYSSNSNDKAKTTESSESAVAAAAAAATDELSSPNDAQAADTLRCTSAAHTNTLDAHTNTRDAHTNTLDAHTNTHDAHTIPHEVSPETEVLTAETKADEEKVDHASISVTGNPLPVCQSDMTPSGDPEAKDDVDADHQQTEDNVTVSGYVKDDVKEGSPTRDDVTVTSLSEPKAAAPRRKNAYLNAVIAELKRKKISRETASTSSPSVTSAAKGQQHHLSQHPSAQLQQPTPPHRTTMVPIKAEMSPERPEYSRSTSEALMLDIQSLSSGLTSSTSTSRVADSSIPLVQMTTADAATACLKSLRPDAGVKDGTGSLDHRSATGTPRTDPWASACGKLPTSDFPHGEAAFWRHLPSMVGTEGKMVGGGKPLVSGRADISSPLSISQLASICGLSQSQLASLPFQPPQFSLYPPYLFMGFPLQPLLPEFPSVSGSLPPSPSMTGGHAGARHPPYRAVPPAVSSSASAAATGPTTQQQQKQQQPRRRRSHHNHRCKSSSDPPKDPLFRQPPPDHHAASFTALRKSESTPTNHSAALLSDLNRWRYNAPSLSSQPLTGSTTKSSASNKVHPTGSLVQDQKLWRPAAAIASSAKEYSLAYESVVPSRPSAHASTKECAVTCRSYGDTSLAAHAYGFDTSAPVDFTWGYRSRVDEERKYGSNTRNEEYPYDDQGVLDLSKK